MKNIAYLFTLLLALTSCDKVITLKYKNNQPKLVIEGNITNTAGPYFVRITKSISLTDTGSYPVVNNAVVTIADNLGNIETLTPLGNGRYQTRNIAGVEGRTYTLTVKVENQTYTAISTMQPAVALDAIKLQTDVIAGDTEYSFIPIYNDPAEKGNNYRFMFWHNTKLYHIPLVQNDEVRNGVVNVRRLDVNDPDIEFKKGDTITIQMQCIDKNVFLYYNTLAQISDGGPGGGTTPNNPPTNISNGALGVFSAHTVATKSIIIP